MIYGFVFTAGPDPWMFKKICWLEFTAFEQLQWKLQIRNCVKKYAAHHFDFWSTHIGSGSTPCCEDMSIMEPSVNITVLLSIHIQSRIYKWNIFPFVLYWNFPLPSFHPGTLKVDVVHFWALIIIFISKSTLLFLQTCASCTNWLARSNMPS